MQKTEDLYTTKDVERIRKLLTEEQGNCCAITSIELAPKQHCLDHAHDEEQYVRGVAHRQANAALGKLEGIYTRYLSYWYPGKLSDFLRQCAAYIEQPHDSRFRHPGWIKKIKTMFNALNEKQKEQVLNKFDMSGTNGKHRKELFSKLVLDRKLGYDTIREAIQSAKEEL